jgi:hypothetical protein
MSCTEQPGMWQRKDETGHVYGRLTVVSFDHIDKHGNACWTVHCECGEEKVVQGAPLRSGVVVSCGCYQRDKSSSFMSWYWKKRRAELVVALFTTGLYPKGRPRKKETRT